MNKFEELGLSQPLIEAISSMGFEEPTAIQSQAIPKLLQDDTDFVGLAQTGTGKTAAFGLPLLDLIEADESQTQALVLAPTRELGLQIARELKSFAKNLKKVKIQAVYGGVDIQKQIRDLRKGAHVIVATPGRLRDLMRRKAVDIREIEYVILDEADEMLNMGFKEEIDEILRDTPEDKLTWLFSATMPKEVQRISRSYMTDPLELNVGHQNSSNADIDHQYVIVKPRDRYPVLRRFLDYEPTIFGLVFTRTRRDARELADRLSRDGYRADALHGDLNQSQRDRVMERFRNRNLDLLIATDVAARGIDVDNVSHVFHYNIPEDIHFYNHRSGRTGRAGRKGISLVLAHPNDQYLLRRLEGILRMRFSEAKVPTGRAICERQLVERFRRLREAEVRPDVESFIPLIKEELAELSRDELISKLASLYFKKSVAAYLNQPDFGAKGKRKFDASNSSRLFINVGAMDVGDKGGFLELICGECQIPGSAIGKITLSHKHTFFDLDKTLVPQVMSELNGAMMNGRVLRVNTEKPRPERKKGGKKFKKQKFRQR